MTLLESIGLVVVGTPMILVVVYGLWRERAVQRRADRDARLLESLPPVRRGGFRYPLDRRDDP
jgi:hypothetical protein